MKRLLIGLAAFSFGCTQPSASPQLGDRYTLTKSSGSLATASAQTWPYEEAKFGNILFDIATNNNSRIVYISTKDPNFRTPEGLGVNCTLEQVIAAGGQPVIYEIGWAHYSKLPSGWCAAFYGTLSAMAKAPSSNSKVAHFFKRR